MNRDEFNKKMNDNFLTSEIHTFKFKFKELEEKVNKKTESAIIINFGRNIGEFRNDLEIFNKRIQDMDQIIRKNTDEIILLKKEIEKLKKDKMEKTEKKVTFDLDEDLLKF
jgi:hypothetical protein